MYAVIKTGGKQYRVSVDDVIEIERTGDLEGQEIEFSDVLMIGSEDTVKVGAPFVGDAKVQGEVLEWTRGEKLTIFKKRRRKHYRRKNGHRQDLMLVHITGIVA